MKPAINPETITFYKVIDPLTLSQWHENKNDGVIVLYFKRPKRLNKCTQ